MFTSDSHQPCPGCSEPVWLNAFYCKACGYQLQSTSSLQAASPQPEPPASDLKQALKQPLRGKTLAAFVFGLMLTAAYARFVFWASLLLLGLLLGQRYAAPLRDQIARLPGLQSRLERRFRPWLVGGLSFFCLSTCMLLAEQGHELNVQQEALQRQQAATARQHQAQQAQAEALQKARQATAAGQQAAAYAAYTEALKHGPLGAEDSAALARSAAAQARHWRQSGKWAEALQAAQTALKANPTDSTLQREALELKALKAYHADDKPADFLSAHAELQALNPAYKGLQAEYRAASARQQKARARAEKEKAVAALRGPLPENSAWDGSVKAVKDYLKDVLNDPDSVAYVDWFKVIPATAPDGQEAWGVKVRFRANNAFGAKITQTWFFYIRHNRVIDASQEPY